MTGETSTILRVERREDFVLTAAVEALAKRGLTYLEAGFPVHLCGQAGTGKTTMAMHLAAMRGRPVVLIYGDEEFGTSDLVGGETGVSSKRVVDNFIRSVLKTEETIHRQWVDQRLTTACKYGYTLVYDDFSRSRPEANNVLLAILEEKLLSLPTSRLGENYMQVHQDFRAIFTSNPEEYAGIHKAQDALLDRMITIHLQYYDRDTETAITMAKSGLSRDEAHRIVDVVRSTRQKGGLNSRRSIRACIMIARIIANQRGQANSGDVIFIQTCFDVLGPSCLEVLSAHGLISKDQELSLTRDQGTITFGTWNGGLERGA
jgi:nitric oxide reductase NorQ protein